MREPLVIESKVVFEWYDVDGGLVDRQETRNLVTAVGDQMYASRGAGLTSSATPTGIKLGTSAAAVTKTGTGAALGAYVPGSNKAFDSGFPTATGGVVTYKRTYAAGEATSATAIAEAALVTDGIATDATSAVANTAARVLVPTPQAKAAADTLTVTWTHTVAGT